jgi:hypothetical protein
MQEKECTLTLVTNHPERDIHCCAFDSFETPLKSEGLDLFCVD